MLVTAIEARPLRSLERVRVPLGPGITSVVGPNGVGKTNLVEALYFALTGRSFRTSDRRDLIPFGESLARAEATVRDADGIERRLLASVSRTEGRRHLLDGNAVDPATIFDARPGEMFVVRNVGNLVPPFEPDQNYHGVSAALEFAVRALKVAHIVVLGHAFCGGVKAFAQDAAPLSESDFIGKWVSQIAPAAAKLGPRQEGEDYLRKLEFASVELSLENLMSFPFVRAAVEAGELTLHGAYFGVASGRLLIRDKSGEFVPVDA